MTVSSRLIAVLTVTLLLACADQLVSPSSLTDHPASSTNVSPTGHVYLVRCNFMLVFKSRLDKFWQHQDLIYDFKAEISGTGSWSCY